MTVQGPPTDGSQNDARDTALMQRIGAGDRVAFETLYRAYFTRLARFLQRMLRRTQVVDEVINDTMYVVWHRARQYSGRSKVSTWIFGIAYRRALKALSDVDDPVDFDETLQPDPQANAPDLMLQTELRAVLERALAELTAEQRAVVELTYFHGCHYREIAQIVGCPVETVKTRMFYARRRLRGLLQAHREDLPWADESSIS